MAGSSFVPLLIRLEHVIEHSVSIDSLIESMRLFIDRVDHISGRTASTLDLTGAQASEVVRVMGVLVVGATRTDQGPPLRGEAIPPDVQELVDLFSSETLFTKNACRIIAGIRAGVSEPLRLTGIQGTDAVIDYKHQKVSAQIVQHHYGLLTRAAGAIHDLMALVGPGELKYKMTCKKALSIFQARDSGCIQGRILGNSC